MADGGLDYPRVITCCGDEVRSETVRGATLVQIRISICERKKAEHLLA